MKFPLLTLSFSLLLAACSHEPESQEPKVPALIIGNPLNYGVTDALIFPVGVTYYTPEQHRAMSNTRVDEGSSFSNANVMTFKSRTYDLADNNAKQEWYNDAQEDADIRNILFYDLNSKESKPLLKDTLHILSFAIHNEFERPCIFYRIVKHDRNEDGKYNSLDPVMLYISNLTGDSLVQVTPENERFAEYFYYPKQQMILVKTIVDMDKDKKFTSADETNMREVNLHNPMIGKEIFDPELKENLRSMVLN